MRAMQQQVQKLKVKSAFLLQNLLVGHPEHKGGQPLKYPGLGQAWGAWVVWGLLDSHTPSHRDPVLHGDGSAAGGPRADRT
jgi:hypothetical protein